MTGYRVPGGDEAAEVPGLPVKLCLCGPERARRSCIHDTRRRIDGERVEVSGPVLVQIRSRELRLIDHGVGVEAGRIDRRRGGRLSGGQNFRDDDLQIGRHGARTVGGEIGTGAAGGRHRVECLVGSHVDRGIDAGAHADDVGVDADGLQRRELGHDVRQGLIVGGDQRVERRRVEACAHAVTCRGGAAERRPRMVAQIERRQSIRDEHDVAAGRAAVARGGIGFEIIVRPREKARDRRLRRRRLHLGGAGRVRLGGEVRCEFRNSRRHGRGSRSLAG